jgi:hypothetical protein
MMRSWTLDIQSFRKENEILHPGLYTSKEELDRVAPALPYAHTVRRAWETMELDGVLYTGRTPTAFFKKNANLSNSEICRLQRQLWNLAVVPTLVLYNDTQIKVYSAWARPTEDTGKPDDDDRLVLEQAAEFVELIQKIETGTLFSDHPKSFDRTQAVDQYLVGNLQAVAQKMLEVSNADTPEPEFIHRFLLRILFVSYLIERGIIKGTLFSKAEEPLLYKLAKDYTLKNILEDCSGSYIQARDTIFRLFLKIKGEFNGSLLDGDLNKEKQKLSAKHIEILHNFLIGTHLKSGQMVLDFWAYDFGLIPIETISTIYERFLDKEGNFREDSGIYYTPPHLAELIVDIATESIPKPLYECRVLDPACGSGVFLVAIFNRMAEEWRRANKGRHKITCARELLDILKNQLVGLDKHGTPCLVACFSLYLAYLDQLDPRDIEFLKEKGIQLPSLVLGEKEKQPSAEKRTLLCRNFFDKILPLPIERFDIIIGNPPWVSRRSSDKTFIEWVKKSNTPKKVLAPQDQIAHGFLWRVRDFLEPKGQACLLMPAAILLNQTNAFQEEWFKSVKVDRIVNFSDLRRFLFSGAIHPSVAIRFSLEQPNIYNHCMVYDTPKTERRTQVGGPVYIYDEDRTMIRLKELLAEAANDNATVVWKSRLWGTGRDRRLLQRLSDLPRLEDIVGTPEKPKLLIKGQGFKPQREPSDNKKAWWSKKDLFIDANKDIDLILLPTDCEPVGNVYEILHRLPAKELFLNPKVLVSQGSANMKVAFADFTVLFRSSLQSIVGTKETSDLLRFMAVVLKSDVSQYFLFHTSAYWGTERDKVLFEELLQLPFPQPEATNNPVRTKEIIDTVASRLKRFSQSLQGKKYTLDCSDRSGNATLIQQECEPLIREYYDIDGYEAMLIDDTLNTFKKSATPGASDTNVKTLGPAERENCMDYTETLCRMLNEFSSGSSYQAKGEIILPGSGSTFALVTLTQTKEKVEKLAVVRDGDPDLVSLLKRFEKSLSHAKRNFMYYRNLKIFDGNKIHLIKPLVLRSWTKTAALNDADEIAGAILGGMQGL